MIELFNADTNTLVGTISEAELQFLIDACEEESSADQDYYITPEFIDILSDDGASEHLQSVLRSAVGKSEGAEIRWQRK